MRSEAIIEPESFGSQFEGASLKRRFLVLSGERFGSETPHKSRAIYAFWWVRVLESEQLRGTVRFRATVTTDGGENSIPASPSGSVVASQKPRRRVRRYPAKMPAHRTTFCTAGRNAKLLAVRTCFGVRWACRCQCLEGRVKTRPARLARICVTRAREIPSRRAISAPDATSPASSCLCHSSARASRADGPPSLEPEPAEAWHLGVTLSLRPLRCSRACGRRLPTRIRRRIVAHPATMALSEQLRRACPRRMCRLRCARVTSGIA